MRYWSVTVSADRYGAERLYHHDVLELSAPEGVGEGDQVALIADVQPPVAFALGEVHDVGRDAGADDPTSPGGEPEMVVAYTRRCFDDPVPAPAFTGPIGADDFNELARRLPVPGHLRRNWLVSVDLPIEAATPGEAVRQYWSYVRQLGPRELPTYVSPAGNELAMQAFVLGEEANQDPEEDD